MRRSVESWPSQVGNDCIHSGNIIYLRSWRDYIVGKEKTRNSMSRDKAKLETIKLSRCHQIGNQKDG